MQIAQDFRAAFPCRVSDAMVLYPGVPIDPLLTFGSLRWMAARQAKAVLQPQSRFPVRENGNMNPRRVHELMRQRFPDRPATASDWVVAADREGLRFDVVQRLVRQHIVSDVLLVEAHRKAGGLFPMKQALDFIASNVDKRRILLTDREFTGFVLIESNGVASGWSPQSGNTEPASNEASPTAMPYGQAEASRDGP